MSSNVVIAKRLMPQVLNELSKLFESSRFLSSSTALEAQNLDRTIKSLKMRFLSDRLLANFNKFSNTAGAEALARELSIRAVTRLKSYNSEISKLMNEIEKIKTIQNLGPEAMGFWPFSDGDAGDVEAEREAGLKMLRAYFNIAKNYSAFKYSDFDSYLASVNRVIDDYPQFIGNLVFINKYSTSVSDAVARIEDLARKSEGQARLQDITQAAGGSGQTTNWSALLPDLIKETTIEAGSKTVTALQEVGDTLIDTAVAAKEGAKILPAIMRYWPIVVIVIGSVIFYMWLPKLPSSKKGLLSEK